MTRRSATCRKGTLALAIAVSLGLAARGAAQFSTGNVYGSVTDESGAVVPGATIRASGATVGVLTTVADGNGDFRFLNLDPGAYRLLVAQPGFTSADREVRILTGQNVELTFSLSVAGVREAITINAASPIVDTKKVGTLTTLSREELSKVPNSRDPWAILRTIPGIVVDRVDIAGNESGQQSAFQGKGADGKDTMWILDGLAITDMTATSTPTYFDFDAFDEISVSTGGNDLRAATGGIGLNFVTRRGTNAIHGNVHGYFTHNTLQASNISGTSLTTDPRLRLPDGTFSDKADHIDQIANYGADLGGPILKDRVWFWGAYGRQDIRNVFINQTKDRTILKDFNGKLNWQASDRDMLSFFYFLGMKEKIGRKPGWVGDEPASFLWNQGNKYDNNPLHGLFKIEDNHIFGPNLFLNVKYAYYNTGFGFDPAGGSDLPGGLDFHSDAAAGSYYSYAAIRPQQTASLDGNAFFSGVGGRHEFKFGFGYRRHSVHSTTAYSGTDKTFAIKYSPSLAFALVTRDRVANFHAHYLSGYAGDTFTRDRLTVSAGLRWDRQAGGSDPSVAASNPAFPNLLPALNYDGRGGGVTWSDVSPRVGVTYALDEGRTTVVRASYARYAGQLAAGNVAYDSPTAGYAYLAYRWIDTNNDRIAQRNEILIGEGLQYFANVDPRDPASVRSPNRIDPGFRANIDKELIVGIDHELLPNFALSAAYTFRKSNNIDWRPRLGLTVNDYTANPALTANGYTANSYSPDAALVAATGGGRILANRPGYWRRYSGFELSLTKRLASRWMARVAGSYMDWVEKFEGGNAFTSGGVQNPSRLPFAFFGTGGPQVDGGQVPAPGKGGSIMAPKWQVIANALCQLPWSFEVAGSFFARQGFARPIALLLFSGADATLPRARRRNGRNRPDTGRLHGRDRRCTVRRAREPGPAARLQPKAPGQHHPRVGRGLFQRAEQQYRTQSESTG